MKRLPPRRKTDVRGLFHRDFPSGRIYYAVYREAVTGRQVEKACRDPETGKPLNKARAKVFRAALISRAPDKQPATRPRVRPRAGHTVRSYYLEWKEEYRGRTAAGIRRDGLHRYCVDIEKHVLPQYGDLLMDEFDSGHLRELAERIATYADSPKRHARGDTRSPSAIRNALGAFKRMYATAVDDRVVGANRLAGARVTPLDTYRTPSAAAVAAGGQLPANAPSRPRALSEPQLKALIGEIIPQYRLLFAVKAATGVHLSEALGWLIQDFDPETGVLRVRQTWRVVTVASGERVGQYRDVKTKYRRRDLRLPESLRKELAKHVRHLPDRPTWPLFPDEVGYPLDQDHLRSVAFNPARTRAGLAWATPKTLRHTFASIQVRNGVDLKRLQLLMGHHDPAFTLRQYVHLFQDDLPEPPEVFSDLAFASDGQTVDAEAWSPHPRRRQRTWSLDECRDAIARVQKELRKTDLTLNQYAEAQRGRSDLPAKSTIIRIAADNGTSFAELRNGGPPREPIE